MSKTKKLTFVVEGPDWEHSVSINPEIFDDERSQLLEAATRGLEEEIKCAEKLNVGPILLVRPDTSTKSKQKSSEPVKEALVNAYLCLVNTGQYELAEDLRINYKKSSNQDLAMDDNGYSF